MDYSFNFFFPFNFFLRFREGEKKKKSVTRMKKQGKESCFEMITQLLTLKWLVVKLIYSNQNLPKSLIENLN